MRIRDYRPEDGTELARLYVHKDCQGRGIATAICDALEQDGETFTTHASITARSFLNSGATRW